MIVIKKDMNHIQIGNLRSTYVRKSVAAFATNELAPIPGQSAAYNAGFSQGYLSVPFKGSHTEQFILGYINGSQGIQDNKAEVAGYMGMPFHWDKKATQCYTQTDTAIQYV